MSTRLINRLVSRPGQKFIWAATVAASGFILAGIFLAPLIHQAYPAFSAWLSSLYTPFCHQLPDRCYYLQGLPLPVCSRCLGFYTGFFLSSLFYPVFSSRLTRSLTNRPGLLLILALPLVIDGLAGLLKIWSSPLPLRTLTGFIFAAVLPFFWFKAFTELQIDSRG